jgi:hypothetical protein
MACGYHSVFAALSLSLALTGCAVGAEDEAGSDEADSMSQAIGDPCSYAKLGNGFYCARALVPGSPDAELRFCSQGVTTQKVSCTWGCRSMPDGMPDQCHADPCQKAALGDGKYCAASLSRTGNKLHTCQAGKTSQVVECASGCQVMPPGVNDQCAAGSSTPPASDPCANAKYGDGDYCPQNLPGAAASTLYSCKAGKTANKTVCSAGCQAMPAGTNDVCKTAAGSESAARLARAQSWVNVGMYYCGGVNWGTDYICGGTCKRPGAMDRPEWNVYRSDCSGFISFVWQLSSSGGGRRTWEFAPFNTAVSYEINASELQTGDALNTTIGDVYSQHIMLFAGWVDKSKGLARIIDEANCSADIVDATRTLTFLGGSRVYVSGRSHQYAAIRKK